MQYGTFWSIGTFWEKIFNMKTWYNSKNFINFVDFTCVNFFWSKITRYSQTKICQYRSICQSIQGISFCILHFISSHIFYAQCSKLEEIFKPF